MLFIVASIWEGDPFPLLFEVAVGINFILIICVAHASTGTSTAATIIRY